MVLILNDKECLLEITNYCSQSLVCGKKKGFPYLAFLFKTNHTWYHMLYVSPVHGTVVTERGAFQMCVSSMSPC